MSSHWRARNFWSNQGAKWKDSDCLQVDMSKKVHRKPRCGKLPPLCYFSISLKCELNVNISILQVVIIEEKTPDLCWIKESWIMVSHFTYICIGGFPSLSPQTFRIKQPFSTWITYLARFQWRYQPPSRVRSQKPLQHINFQRSLFWRTNHLRLRTHCTFYHRKYQTPSSGTAVYTSIYNRNRGNPQNKKHPPNFFAQNKGSSVLRMEGT